MATILNSDTVGAKMSINCYRQVGYPSEVVVKRGSTVKILLQEHDIVEICFSTTIFSGC